MREEHREKGESKGIFYEGLEAFAREKIRQHLQDLLEQEVTEWLGRAKSERQRLGAPSGRCHRDFGRWPRQSCPVGNEDDLNRGSERR